MDPRHAGRMAVPLRGHRESARLGGECSQFHQGRYEPQGNQR